MRKPTSLSMNYPALLGLVVTLALPITTQRRTLWTFTENRE